MKPADYLFAFRKITEEMCALTAAKNKDYSGDHDAFANFRLVEQIGLCPTEVGILTRLSDKLARVGRLLNKSAAVKSESVEDTLLDMAVYSIILLVYLRSKVPYAIVPSDLDVKDLRPGQVNYVSAKDSAAPHAFYSTHEDTIDRHTDPSMMSDAEIAARLAR